MGLRLLLLAAFLAAAPAAAQTRPASPAESTPPSPSSATAEPPTSLERIREGLKQTTPSILQGLNRQSDFRIEIQEQQRLEEMFKRLQVKPGPIPAGGLYMFEQQRMLFNPTDRPLMQPYAAFSGSELITIAIQNLLGRYLGKPLVQSLRDSYRSREEEEAREEVRRSIAVYCGARPDAMDMRLCNPDAR